MKTTASEPEILQIVRGDHHDPFAILGAHRVVDSGETAVAIRAFVPEASAAAVIPEGFEAPVPMERVHPAGFFEAVFPGRRELFQYRLAITTHEGYERKAADPYSFWPVLGDLDIHLFNEGTFLGAHEKLGAHILELGGVRGVFFAVWAPNARRVSVVGDFNSWDGRRHPMRVRGGSGLWELFIPDMTAGDRYKYEVRTSRGEIALKADPFGFHAELRPRSASIVYELGDYDWGDEAWMRTRREHNGLDRPMSIYELHLGSWKRNVDGSWKTYRQLAEELVPYVREMGFTHVELLPVNEHPFDGSWGYQVTGYFAPTSRFGEPHDFMHFVDTCHRSEIGVILDWVPAHFPTDEHGLRSFDGTCLYEHEDPRLGLHQDWGTAIFNFGRNEVRNFLVSNALFWLDKYHIDGLRVDAVASMLYLDYSRKAGEWIPNRYGGKENLEAISFLRDMNSIVHARHGDVLTIAEESTAWPGVSRPVYLGGLGFSLKWNMGWMHDMLAYFSKDPIHRKFHHSNLTFALMYAFEENFVLVFSHDEVVHMKGSMLRKMPGDVWQKFANLRALYSLMWAFPGKKLLYMGGEFGQWEEWNHDRQLDWFLLEHEFHPKLLGCVRDLNRLYRELPQLHRIDFHHGGFEWTDFADSEQSIISFLRKADDPADFVLVVGNFTPVPRAAYRVGVPLAGEYDVLFNSDAAAYGGSNLGDGHIVVAEKLECQGRPFSLSLTLPPLAVLYLRPRSFRE